MAYQKKNYSVTVAGTQNDVPANAYFDCVSSVEVNEYLDLIIKREHGGWSKTSKRSMAGFDKDGITITIREHP